MNEDLRLRARVFRAEIVSGSTRGPRLRGNALAELIRDVPVDDRDTFVDEMLGIDNIPYDDGLPPGAVPYLPAPVDEILRMVREVPVRATDEFVDLGSGIGRVSILVHLVAGAKSSGIEIQGPLVAVGRERCKELELDVQLIKGNAVETELSGNIFFLYSPFNGEMLRTMLARLEAHARTRPVVICTVDLELDRPWLVPRKTSSLALFIYDARPV